jgi:nucleotide-binding universal stress UspA family protein
MHTILVLTDFSEASAYAASYACIVARQLNASNIVLYHSYKSVVTPGESVVYTGDDDSMHHVAIDALIGLAASLSDQIPDGCDLRYQASTKSLEEINVITDEEKADLIVMGTTGKGKIESLVAGSHAITVCETSEIPVLLVPEHVPMDPVRTLVFACDMKETEMLPKNCIDKMIREFHVPLSVLHVNNGKEAEDNALEEWLDVHNPEFHEVESDDTGKGILDFAAGAPGSLILVVAKKHGFPSGLFHKSITKQLAFESVTPLLVMRENEAPVPVMPLLEI